MKKINIAVFLALVGSGFYTQSAHAALTFTAGDIFIGFVDGNAPTNDMLVDVGSASLYTTPGTTFSISPTFIGSASTNNTNLNTVFAADGLGWYNSTDTSWGIIGGPLSTDASSTLYIGLARSTDSIPTTAPTQDNNGNQAGYATKIGSLETFYKNSGTALNGTDSTSQLASNANSFNTLGSGSVGAPFGDSNLNGVFLGNINGDGLGDSGDVIDLWKTPSTTGGAPVLEGHFTIASTGGITYTPTSAVPEPSALIALAGGAGLLGLIRRRRAVVA